MVMQAGFPRDLHADVAAVSAIVPRASHEPAGSFAVTIAGQPITIPYRIYYEEPAAERQLAPTARQRLLLGCWYTRHHGGFVRQRHLEHIIGSPQPWVVPYVVQLAGEYVIEILEIIRRELTIPRSPEPLTMPPTAGSLPTTRRSSG